MNLSKAGGRGHLRGLDTGSLQALGKTQDGRTGWEEASPGVSQAPASGQVGPEEKQGPPT